jgi:hypothetical protein
MNDYTIQVTLCFEVIVSANSEESAEDFIGQHSVEDILTHQTHSPDMDFECMNSPDSTPTWTS